MYKALIISLLCLATVACKQKANKSNNNSQETTIQQPLSTSTSQTLSWKNIEFKVKTIKENGFTSLNITTKGLEIQDYNETFDIVGETIVNTEVSDLNNDDSPELLIFTQSVGSGSYGQVYAFSVNNKKSMSQVYFIHASKDDKAGKGYMGHDQFAVVDHTLTHRFPIYKDGDSNANPTGGIRVITYKLVNGENSRRLEIERFSDKN